MKKKKRLTLSKAKKKAWKQFSRYIRLRDALRTTQCVDIVKCITCNMTRQTKEVDAGHFYSRSNSSILFDEKNVHAQCKKCNMPPDPGEQYLYSQRMIDLYGEEEVERLTGEKGKIYKFTINELLDIEKEYKDKFEELLDGRTSPWKS